MRPFHELHQHASDEYLDRRPHQTTTTTHHTARGPQSPAIHCLVRREPGEEPTMLKEAQYAPSVLTLQKPWHPRSGYTANQALQLCDSLCCHIAWRRIPATLLGSTDIGLGRSAHSLTSQSCCGMWCRRKSICMMHDSDLIPGQKV